MLLSTGERSPCALCAMAINDLGHRAISLTGSQAGIVTDTSHTKARILDVRADRIRDALDEDAIVLVAGFQGVSTARDVTTLGRGGSRHDRRRARRRRSAPTSARSTPTSPASSRADPRIVPDARKLPVVSFEEMLEMAASRRRRAAAALRRVRAQPRRAHPLPVELRRRAGYRCRRRGGDRGAAPHHRRHALDRGGPRHAHRRARHAGHRGPDRDGARRGEHQRRHDHPERARLRAAPARTCPSRSRATDLHDGAPRARRRSPPSTACGSQTDEEMGKVSIIGAGMKTHPGVAAKVFTTLGDEGINIEMISTSPDQDLLRHPRRPRARGRARAAFRLRAVG